MKLYIQAYSLVEMMIVLVIIAILMTIAVPQYQAYQERHQLEMAKQYMLRIALALERYKAKNFSYRGFDLHRLYPSFDVVANRLTLPVDQTPVYVLSLVDLTTQQPLSGNTSVQSRDATFGKAWSMVVHPVDGWQQNQYSLLLNSHGVRCMSKVQGVVTHHEYCGSNAVAW